MSPRRYRKRTTALENGASAERQGNLTTFVIELPLWVDLSDGITQELKPEPSADIIDGT